MHVFAMRNTINLVSAETPETAGDLPSKLSTTSLRMCRLIKAHVKSFHEISSKLYST